MASNKKLGFVLSLLLLMTTTTSIEGNNNNNVEEQVPCVFIFGDSLSDNGNNNNLHTSAKCSYRPYGIDFPDGPTGRFTNGRTSIDIITQLLGFKEMIPPFAKLGGFDILKGVNYASGGAGIRVETGTQLGADVSLEIQLENHRKIVSEILAKLGGFEKAQAHLNKCLYYFNIGSNDFINNYFLPQYYPTSQTFTLENFAGHLIQNYSLTLRAMHDELGGRKFVLVGLGAIGCTPRAISRKKNSPLSLCDNDMNEAALIFNSKLKSLVDLFNYQLSDSKFIFINSFSGMLDHHSIGFKVLTEECCKVWENGQCAANEKPCKNRNDYAFFDSFHPTEAANIITAMSSYNASNPVFTYPMDIYHLVHS
ncbi:hypothetical protein QN277_005818 [Acacia crassicarpa]|uniref:GDSL esterase/lipase n=1 Tax=Acacia crassicarpa TaxID=499986 RepID=A0AAE1MEM8_9FABA|nr:hypothetical protein QN277_005818 [Acacia crassicarpa]